MLLIFVQQPFGDLGFTYAKKQRKVPSVLTPNKVQLILSHISGVNHTTFSLLYGSGIRINECLRITSLRARYLRRTRITRTFGCRNDTNLYACYWRTFCWYCQSTKQNLGSKAKDKPIINCCLILAMNNR